MKASPWLSLDHARGACAGQVCHFYFGRGSCFWVVGGQGMFCAEMCPAPHLPATRSSSQPQSGLDRTLRSSWIKKCGGYDSICDSELNSPDISAQEQFSQCHIIQRGRTFFDKRACTRWRLPGAACHSAEQRISNSAISSQAAIFVPRGCASSPLKRCLLRQRGHTPWVPTRTGCSVGGVLLPPYRGPREPWQLGGALKTDRDVIKATLVIWHRGTDCRRPHQWPENAK